MRLPAYPLITVDPFFSIWSKTENLYDSETQLWCGIKKRITGHVFIDGEKYRFMSKSKCRPITQTKKNITAVFSEYTFETNEVEMTVTFWTPELINDTQLLSFPCSYIDYAFRVKDKKEHTIKTQLSVGKEFCYNASPKLVIKKKEVGTSYSIGKMGRKIQKPASKSGDGVSADWGQIAALSQNVKFGFSAGSAMKCVNSLTCSSKCRFFDILAFDEIYAVEFFGEKIKPLWTENFSSINSVLLYCKENHDQLKEKAMAQNEMIVSDAAKYGSAYQNILSAAFRQILAAHKLIKNSRGELMYLSKECHSNGCINTVDVSYPAIPIYLIYNPELVKAMLVGIFEFARKDVWTYDFAPHDIGQYPIANGQVYGLIKRFEKDKKNIYRQKENVFEYKRQMPVEECGNMLIMSYAYYLLSGDKEFIEKNYDLLKQWADYLKQTGIVLENQLCTDDFAGHVNKNVNLAIKSIMGLGSYSRIAQALNKDGADDFMNTAREFAQQLYNISKTEDYLSFSLDNKNSWSLKYNLVWDILFDFAFFPKELYKAESLKYRKEMQKYGTPLDYRKNFTKSDWLIWASVLDESEENVDLFSQRIEKYLNDTQDLNCFTDWFCTDKAKEMGMNHRSVQGGLWMPLLRDKLIAKGEK